MTPVLSPIDRVTSQLRYPQVQRIVPPNFMKHYQGFCLAESNKRLPNSRKCRVISELTALSSLWVNFSNFLKYNEQFCQRELAESTKRRRGSGRGRVISELKARTGLLIIFSNFLKYNTTFCQRELAESTKRLPVIRTL
jgi:hypothetical protein